MNTFLLSFDANTTFSGGNPPTLEILVGGVVVSSVTMSSGATSYDFFIPFTGTSPSTLSFRFDGASGDPGDTISFTSVFINDNALNVGTDLTSSLITQGQNSGVTAPSTSFGHAVPTLSAPTITGTGGDDQIQGTSGADSIDALGGNDYVTASGGDDEVDGGAGADLIFGEAGADTILGGAGDDTLFGDGGDDTIFGEGDNDFLIGGDGNDVLNGGAGSDGLLGDAGDDMLFGEDGDDWLVGDAGDDILIGDAGNDILLGGADNDSLSGGDDNDQLIGGAGNDLLDGGDGIDELIGEAGVDTIDGGAGADSILGGLGADIIDGGDDNDDIALSNGDFAAGESLTGGAGTDSITFLDATTVDFQTGTINTVETLTGNVGNDTVTMSALQFVDFTTIDLAGGTDILNVQATGTEDISALGLPTVSNVETGNLTGSAGNDDLTITGTQVDAIISGGGTIDFGAGASDTLNLTSVSADLTALSATDGDIVGLETIDASTFGTGFILDMSAQTEGFILTGGAFDDTVTGSQGTDTINGGGGVDTLVGYEGDDTINGDAGNDIIVGGDGVSAQTTPLLSYGGGQDVGGTVTQFTGGVTLDGNLWKKVLVDYTVTANTVIEFDFRSTVEAEVSGIGFDNDNTIDSNATFKVYGTQAWGRTNFDNYDGSGEFTHYTIDVGSFYTGTFSHLFFVNDDDGGGVDGNGSFANIIIYESTAATDDDSINGGADDDQLLGGEGIDTLNGGAGADILSGNAGGDTLNGDAGADILHGGDGNDTLNGGTEVDELYGGAGVDTLNGDAGADTLDGGAGADIIDGGADNDSILLANGNFAAGESITGGAGTDNITLTNATTINFTIGTLATIETLTGSAGNDTVTLSALQFVDFTTINLVGGTDILNVQATGTEDISALGLPTVSNVETGNLMGSAGADDLTLTAVQLDAIISGTGIIDFDVGIDVMNIDGTSADLNILGVTDGSILGLEEIDASSAGAGVTIDVSGQTEDLTVTGGGSGDTIDTGDGDDTINGGGNNDVLSGNAGSDTLNGDAGNDTLNAFDGATPTVVTLLNEAFAGGATGAFTYSDGGFGGTDGANVSVTGPTLTTDGNIANGALRVFVDGQNNSAFTNGSGSYDASVSHTADLGNVQITFSYRHILDSPNDNGEDSQVWFEFNGTAYDASGGNSFIHEHQGAGGGGADDDTGWVTVTIDLPDITASTVYNLSMGILHLGSSRSNEDAEVRFDDITITGTEGSGDVGEINTLNGGAGDDTLNSSEGNDILNGGADNDTINGNGGNDTATGGAGNDTLDGGGGTDTAVFAGNWADYTITLLASTYTLVDNVGTDGTDTATLFENFQFADGTLSEANLITGGLAITSDGGGDTATASTTENTTAVTTVVAAGLGTMIYSISGGLDASLFSISSTTGVLSFLAAPDYEIPTDSGTNNVYDVEVSATNGTLTDVQSVSVSVTDVAEGDVGNTIGTAGTLTVGGSVLYEVDTSGDRDWFGINLTGGTQYAFWARGTPTEAADSTDPRIYGVYDATSTLVSGGNDDGGVGFESLLYFTPGTTGTYYIDAGAWGAVTGGILLSAFVAGATTSGGGGGTTLNGSANADYIDGNGGNDTINGLGGSDILEGGTGNDTLDGGSGADVLYGGTGADTFMLAATDAVDSIVDFTTGDGDVLDISNILVGWNAGTDDIDDYLQFQTVGGNTVVRVDVDGLANGVSFAEIAVLEGNTGEVVQTLYDNGDIIA